MVDNLHRGGMERIIAELARRIDAQRFDTHVLALGYVGQFGEGLGADATVHIAAPMPRWSMLYPRALAQQIAAIGPDVVHLHSGVLYKGSLAASIAGIPYQIYTDHGRQNPDPWTYRMIDKLASRRIDIVVAVSDTLRTHLAGFLKHPSRIRVVRNGVDTGRFAPAREDMAFRREIDVGMNVPLIGSVGRLESVKGYSVMLEAFARLRSFGAPAAAPVLIIVGDGSERAKLEQESSELGISDSVHFIGWRNDIEQIAHSFCLFCMSSHSEGTSVSLLEAMSAGICPVVTNVGGNCDVLGPELAHRLVPAADSNALAQALIDALSDVARLEHDSQVARSRVVRHFSLEAMVDQYEALYLMARNGSGFAL